MSKRLALLVAALLALAMTDAITPAADAQTFFFFGSPQEGARLKDTTPTLTGTAPEGQLDISVSGCGTTQNFTNVPISNGSWSVTTNALANGDCTETASQNGSTYTHHFSIDTVAPGVTITSPASGTTSNFGNLSIRGTRGTAAGDSPTVIVNVYSGSSASGTPADSLQATVSDSSWFTMVNLADGVWTVQARQSDSATNVGLSNPVVLTVDSTPPGVSIDKHPRKRTWRRKAVFMFSSPEPAATFAGFKCEIDDEGLEPCTSGVTYTKLRFKRHTFRVLAFDTNGNVSGASFKWRVVHRR